MYNNPNRLRNIELPENLFSNLGETRKFKTPIIKDTNILKDSEKEEILKEYNIDNNIKLTNYSNKKEYRDRISKMYEDIKDITPIDNIIDNTLYFNNYLEKGIVVKPKKEALKQFWTEYRLISNEKNNSKFKNTQKTITEKLNNFDDLFEALSLRVTEINKYIDELKEIRTNIDISSNKLEEDKEKLQEEKKKFLDFKKDEENKINKEKETLKVNYDRLQTIIDDLDKKLNEIQN
jgi:hypothetical protein